MPLTLPVRTRDPLRTWQFEVRLDGEAVAGVQRVGGLTVSIGNYEVWEGGNNRHRYANPDKVTWDPITLEQGVALDDTLERWGLAMVHFASYGVVPDYFRPLKRDVEIVLQNPYTTPGAGDVIRGFRVRNAWVSKYVAMPKLDSLGTEVGLISVELIHEGWVPLEDLDAADPFPGEADLFSTPD